MAEDTRSLDARAESASLEIPYRLKHLIEVSGGASKLALVFQTSPTQFYEWITRTKDGKVRLPNGYSLLRLALATGVDLNWLFTGKGQPPSPPPKGEQSPPESGHNGELS